jgi:hypothetical protein
MIQFLKNEQMRKKSLLRRHPPLPPLPRLRRLEKKKRKVASKERGFESPPGVDVIATIFLRFSTIFRRKYGVFLKNQCCDQIFE